MQMHSRIPASRNGHQIAGNPVDSASHAASVRTQRHHPSAINAFTALDIHNRLTAADVYAARPHLRLPITVYRVAAIDQCSHFDASPLQIQRGAVRTIVITEHQCALARFDGITLEIGGDCRSQHHTRSVVVAKHQRAFDAAGRQNYPSGTHPPETLAWPGNRRSWR